MTEPSYVPEPDHPPRIARFGTFEVDFQQQQLRREGREVRLQVQPFRILALLVERAGQIVSREELRDRLWPSEFVDFDHSLNAAIRKLREALGDAAENPRFVETLARRGYRFIAPVSWDGPQPVATNRRPMFVVAAILAVLIAALVYVAIRKPVAAPAQIDAVAVLPFTNDDPQTQYFSDGLTEILIDQLSHLPDLRVMARTTVFAYRGMDARKTGETLHVAGVITGHVRHVGDRYEIHVELIDVKDGTQLWGYQFEATPATLSSVHTMISEELTTVLRQGVDREHRRLLASGYTTNSKAYDHYLWGLYALNRRDLNSALNWFNDAVTADPNFAAAYAGLATTYGVMNGYGRIPTELGVPKVLALARKTLEIDPNNAEALVSIATTKYRNLWDFKGADEDYRRALALNPNYATGHEWYADYLRSMGRTEEAKREIEVSHSLDPLSPPINVMMCFSFYYERRYNEAIAYARQARARHPDCGAPSCVASALMALGDIDGAMKELKEAKPVTASGPYPKEPRKFFAAAAAWLEQNPQAADTPVSVAAMHARAGDKDKAFAWLEKAYEHRASMLTNVNVDPAFDSLRSDPRYDALLKRIGLPRVN